MRCVSASSSDVDTFTSLCNGLHVASALSSRTECVAALSAVLAVLRDTPDFTAAVMLAAGQCAPVHHGVVGGVGKAAMLEAAELALGVPAAVLAAKARDVGDLGTAVKAEVGARGEVLRQGPPPQCRDVVKLLVDLGSEGGSGSAVRRQEAVAAMMKSLQSDVAAQFFVRLVMGSGLRTGLGVKSVLAALAHAVDRHPRLVDTPDELEALYRSLADGTVADPEWAAKATPAPRQTVDAVQRLYAQHPDLAALVPSLVAGGVDLAAKECVLTLGVPALAMLAVAAKSPADVAAAFRRRGPFTLEHKYDGERVQVHGSADGATTVFTRTGEDATYKFRDGAAAVRAAAGPGVSSFVMEGEAVPVDAATGAILPFHALSTRGRVWAGPYQEGGDTDDFDAAAAGGLLAPLQDTDAPVCVFAFDLLHLNGTNVMDQPLQERRSLLRHAFAVTPSAFEFVKFVDVDVEADADADDVTSFVADATMAAVDAGYEGVMAKPLTGTASQYVPGSRTKAWLKLKSDADGVLGGDTVDAVPIGAWWGRGRRAGVFGSFLMACRDDATGTFQSVCKLGTGFSDADLQAATAELEPVDVKPEQYQVSSALKPDVWFPPTLVWEVKATEATVSPVHSAAAGLVQHGGKGVGLRFPRFHRRRPDKRVDDATSSDAVAALLNNKAGKQ